MAPAKAKPQKMSLGDFLGDVGSWADEMEDMPVFSSDSRTGYGAPRRDQGSTSNDRYAGFSRADHDSRFPIRQQLPIPDKPPYTAYVGNLAFEVTEEEIRELFASCDVTSARIVRDKMDDRSKGFGYVEFEKKEGLVAALELNYTQLSGRPVRVSVAEPQKDRIDERFAGEWRRNGPLPPSDGPQRRGSDRGDRFNDRFSEAGDRTERRPSSFENDGKLRDLPTWERKGPLPSTPTGSEYGGRPRSNDREFRRRSPAPGGVSAEGPQRREYREQREPRQFVERQPTAAEMDNEWRRGARPDPQPAKELPVRSGPASPIVPAVRPKLELKKRSEQPPESAPASATETSTKASPFGAAKPIDTFQREREIEERRAAAAIAKKAREDKAREDKAREDKAREDKAREEKKGKATSEEKEKESDSGTPTGSRNYALLRKASAATEGAEVDSELIDEEEKKEMVAKEEEKKTAPVSAAVKVDNWRTPRAEKLEEDTEGWTPVAGKSKRGRGGANGARAGFHSR